jgi:hypothetical protein
MVKSCLPAALRPVEPRREDFQGRLPRTGHPVGLSRVNLCERDGSKGNKSKREAWTTESDRDGRQGAEDGMVRQIKGSGG